MLNPHIVSFILALLLQFVGADRNTTFDFIIVGAGTAGLVVANRLSENADVQVLVIEAGYSGLDNKDSTFPERNRSFIFTPGPLHWTYFTEPQVLSDGKPKLLLAGTGIGGTSLINGMQYLRAEAGQINAWERAGNPGWTWEALLPYYKKSESLKVPTKEQLERGASFEPQFHGFDGPVHTGWPRKALQSDWFLILKEAFRNLGIPSNLDPNDGNGRGVATFPRATTPGKGDSLDVRADSGRSYYYPVQDRPNLHMMTGTTALRLLWDASKSSEGEAVANSVEVLLPSGERSVINATSEIIVSCSSYGSPALLEHSGVGNPSILSKHGIETVVDLPGVGENLMDQSLTLFNFNATAGSNYTDNACVSWLTIADLYGPNATAFASATRASLPAYAAKIAEHNNGAASAAHVLKLLEIQHSLLFHEGVPCMELFQGIERGAVAGQAWGSMPFARGHVHIKSSDPLAPPSIDPRYWQFEYDVAVNARAARFVRALYLRTEPLSGILRGEWAAPGTAPVPPPDDGDEAWVAWVKANYFPVWHNVGTAAMLPREAGGVTSPRCRVWGTRNVRVVDASVFPFQTSGHPSSTVYAVAEYCSDLIKEDLEGVEGGCWAKKSCPARQRLTRLAGFP